MDASRSVTELVQSNAENLSGVLPTSHEIVTAHIHAELQGYLHAQVVRAQKISPRYEKMWQSLSRVVLGGGKRMRPYLFVLAYEMYANSVADEHVFKAACGIEMLHQATLIHDDVFDRDYMRHGIPNISAEFRDEYTDTHAISENDVLHLAHSTAVLAGDVAIGGAYELVRKSGLPTSQILALEDILDEALFAVVGGELLDNETVGTDMSATNTETIVRFKTASLSFVSPLISGALLANASNEQVEYLKTFGNELGIAFQYADDVLGVFGDSGVTGKSTKSDLEEGKHTLLAQQAFTRASDDDAETLTELFGKKDLTDEEANKIREIFIKTGAKQHCVDRKNEHTEKAVTVIETLNIRPEYKQALRAVVVKATRRDH